MAASIFISYRRADAQDICGRIYDNLKERFGNSAVFLDIDTLQPGDDFPQQIERTLAQCAVVLVVIGSDWLYTEDEQRPRRLDNPNDYVRLEVETALRYASEDKLVLIPLLIGQATMPSAESLPNSLKPLTRKDALRIHQDNYYKDSVRKLVERVEDVIAERSRRSPDYSLDVESRPQPALTLIDPIIQQKKREDAGIAQ